MLVAAESLKAHVRAILRSSGVPESDAATVADCLVGADLDGMGTHGVSRLPFYCRRLKRGLIDPNPSLVVVSSRPATALLDAGNALGPVAGLRAMEMACELATAAGTGACAVRRSNHLGMVAWYVELGARRGLVALAFGNTPPAMAPPGGRTPLLGTNPLAAAFPTTGEPVVIDMATSLVARGRIRKAQSAGEPIPEGWAVGPDGRPTTDAELAMAGSLEPMGGAKGFALALMVEALTGVLAGAGVGPGVTGTFADSDSPSDVGHLFLAFDPGAFAPGFPARMELLAEAIRTGAAVSDTQPPRAPGDRRYAERAHRLEAGIELPVDLVGELDGLAAETGASSRLRPGGAG